MLIFRNSTEGDSTEVIEITTEAYATMYPPGWKTGEFYSRVTVTCTRREIDDNDNNREILAELRALPNVPSSRPHTRSRFDAVRSLRKK